MWLVLGFLSRFTGFLFFLTLLNIDKIKLFVGVFVFCVEMCMKCGGGCVGGFLRSTKLERC